MEILKKKKKKGFTLIELLVVIAIIGILASIVLVSVNQARNRAKNSAIQSNVSSVRTEAEMLYDSVTPNSYATLCVVGDHTLNEGLTTTNIPALEAGITNNQATANVVCYADTSHFCVQANLNGGGAFCIDDTGAAGTNPAACDATFDCATD